MRPSGVPQRPATHETMGRWGAALALGLVIGLALSLLLSPSLGTAARVLGVLAALTVALGMVRRRPELLDK